MRKFVIVTPVLNGRRFVGETLLSISRQSYPNWVHIVVDGGSTDGTVEFVEAAISSEPRLRLISGKDRGIYDAIFKGFGATAAEAAPEDILLWLNADDMLAPWALVTMAQAFESGADWVSALPGQWDEAGRLDHIIPMAWYPRRLIRWGLFHARALGWIQQESTFFTRRLVDRADPAVIARIRATKLAGDFILWREFARHAPLMTLPTVIAGFRLHGGNATSTVDRYFDELAGEGIRFPPAKIGNLMRRVFRLAALLVTASRARALGRAAERRPRN